MTRCGPVPVLGRDGRQGAELAGAGEALRDLEGAAADARLPQDRELPGHVRLIAVEDAQIAGALAGKDEVVRLGVVVAPDVLECSGREQVLTAR